MKLVFSMATQESFVEALSKVMENNFFSIPQLVTIAVIFSANAIPLCGGRKCEKFKIFFLNTHYSVQSNSVAIEVHASDVKQILLGHAISSARSLFIYL